MARNHPIGRIIVAMATELKIWLHSALHFFVLHIPRKFGSGSTFGYVVTIV